MTIEEVLKKNKFSTAMVKGSIKASEKRISNNENIIFAIPIDINNQKKVGILTITDQKILFVHNALGIGFSKEIPLSTIQSIDSKTGTVIRKETVVITGLTDTIYFTQLIEITNKIKNAIYEAQSYEKITPSTASFSSADELKKYKELLDTGIISQEEFDFKKKQLLGM